MSKRIPARALFIGVLMTGAVLAFHPEPFGQLSFQLGQIRDAVTSPAKAADTSPNGWLEPYVYYSPLSDLGRVDGQIIDQAKQHIDIAAFTITDLRVIDAIENAALRGVRIRLYMDAQQYTQFRSRGGRDLHAFQALLSAPNITVKLNAPGASWMHLKGYAVDGQVLRSGSANFTYAGEREQDNDLVLVPSTNAVASFEHNFEIMWNRTDNQQAQ